MRYISVIALLYLSLTLVFVLGGRKGGEDEESWILIDRRLEEMRVEFVEMPKPLQRGDFERALSSQQQFFNHPTTQTCSRYLSAKQRVLAGWVEKNRWWEKELMSEVLIGRELIRLLEGYGEVEAAEVLKRWVKVRELNLWELFSVKTKMDSFSNSPSGVSR